MEKQNGGYPYKGILLRYFKKKGTITHYNINFETLKDHIINKFIYMK